MQGKTFRATFIKSLLCAAVGASCYAQPPAAEEQRKQAERLAHYALFDQAVEAYRVLVDAAPGEVAMRLSLADACYNGRRFEEAQREYQAILHGEYTSAQKALARSCLADIHRKLDQRAEARQEYETARQLAAGQAGVEVGEVNARVKRGTGLLDWEKVQGQKTHLYFPPDSPSKEGAQETARFFDTRIALIERLSGHSFPGKLEVYCFSTLEQWQSILGGWTWNGGSPQEKTVYLPAGRTPYNLMRILSFYLGNEEMKDLPRSTFIANGFAAAFARSRSWGNRILSQSQQLKQQGKIPPLTDLLKSTSQENTTTALGASFVWHLTKIHGEAKFIEFWRAFNDSDNALSDVYGKQVSEVEAQWLDSIEEIQ